MCRKLWGDDIINSLIWIFIRTGQEMFSEKIWSHNFLISYPIFIIFAPICREIFMLSFEIMVILDWTSPLSVKASTLASLFAVEAHDERVRVIDLIIQVRCAIIAGMRRAFADPCMRISSQGKEDRLVVLLRITRKLMNTVCHLLKSCAAITGWWGLLCTYISSL